MKKENLVIAMIYFVIAILDAVIAVRNLYEGDIGFGIAKIGLCIAFLGFSMLYYKYKNNKNMYNLCFMNTSSNN